MDLTQDKNVRRNVPTLPSSTPLVTTGRLGNVFSMRWEHDLSSDG